MLTTRKTRFGRYGASRIGSDISDRLPFQSYSSFSIWLVYWHFENFWVSGELEPLVAYSSDVTLKVRFLTPDRAEQAMRRYSVEGFGM